MDSKWIRVNSLNLDNEFTKLELNPHPLQSQLWGNVRNEIDSIDFDNYVAYCEKKFIGYARIEKRRIFKFIKLAWIPKGPTIDDSYDRKELINNLMNNLKERGFSLLITDRYKETPSKSNIQTIKLNLYLDESKILGNMHPNIRYAIRRSKRENIIFNESCDIEDIKTFYKMCKDLSNKKNFKLPGSESMMIALIKNSNKKSYIQFQLWLGKDNDKIVCGAITAKCMKSIHYMWGSSLREYSKYGVSESLQWYIIKNSKRLGATIYDFEGINKKFNLGGYNFKKRFGGEEIYLEGTRYYPLNLIGKMIYLIINLNVLIKLKINNQKKNIFRNLNIHFKK